MSHKKLIILLLGLTSTFSALFAASNQQVRKIPVYLSIPKVSNENFYQLHSDISKGTTPHEFLSKISVLAHVNLSNYSVTKKSFENAVSLSLHSDNLQEPKSFSDIMYGTESAKTSSGVKLFADVNFANELLYDKYLELLLQDNDSENTPIIWLVPDESTFPKDKLLVNESDTNILASLPVSVNVNVDVEHDIKRKYKKISSIKMNKVCTSQTTCDVLNCYVFGKQFLGRDDFFVFCKAACCIPVAPFLLCGELTSRCCWYTAIKPTCQTCCCTMEEKRTAHIDMSDFNREGSQIAFDSKSLNTSETTHPSIKINSILVSDNTTITSYFFDGESIQELKIFEE